MRTAAFLGALIRIRLNTPPLRASGSAAFYLYAYSVLYFVTKLEMERVASWVIYFGYMLIVAIAFFLFTGSVGFLACFWFVRLIYGAIKID